MRRLILFFSLATRCFRLLATAILVLIEVAPISAQFDDLADYTLDCNTLDIVTSVFGSECDTIPLSHTPMHLCLLVWQV